MRVDVSIGELVDKLSILDIKLVKISNSKKREQIEKEISALQEGRSFVSSFPQNFWYTLLVHINTQIWELTDRVKGLSWEKDTIEFANLSNAIFELNQQRFRLKDRFNKSLISDLQEQKSYADKVIYLKIDSLEKFYKYLGRINKISLDYDRIEFVTQFKKEVSMIYSYFPYTITENTTENTMNIENLPVSEFLYEFPTLSYYGNSRLGDVILGLSICAEMFYKFGRKACVYIDGNNFKYPLTQTYNDTYSILSSQIYMHSYKVYNKEHIDIKFEDVGKSPFMNSGSWHEIFKSVWNIEWGSHPWIVVPKNPELKDIIFIHASKNRHHTKTDMRILMQANSNVQFVFLSDTDEEYQEFVMRTGCQIPFYKANTFTELAIAINSCRLFMGNLSMPNALADALHKDRVTMLCGWPDDKRNINMGHIWPMQKHLLN